MAENMSIDELRILLENCGIETTDFPTREGLLGLYGSLHDTGLFDGFSVDAAGTSSSSLSPPPSPPPASLPPAATLPLTSVGAILPVDQSSFMASASTGSLSEKAEDQSERNTEALLAFCSITGSEVDAATRYLEALDWNVDRAVEMFLDNPNSGSVQSPNFINRIQAPPIAPQRNTMAADTRLPINPPFRPGPYFDWNETDDVTLDHLSDFDGRRGGLVHSPTPIRHETQYDEDGVRVADQAQMRRLLSREESSEFGRAEDANVDWMFPPPNHLSYPHSLEKAKEKATEEGKLLLVNIQSHMEFAAQLLNRDTWVGDTMEEVLRSSFVFWQRGHTTGDGKNYMRLYQVSEDDLPHIGILDPRTGRKLVHISGFMSRDDMIQRLTDEVDRHPIRPRAASLTDTAAAAAAAVAVDDAHAKVDASAVNAVVPTKEDGVLRPVSAVSAPGASDTMAVPEVGRSCLPDYGPVFPEPTDLENSVVISLRFGGGKPPYTRKYSKSDLVRMLYAVALEQNPAEAGDMGEPANSSFELTIRLPGAPQLVTQIEKTIGECNLDHAVVFMRWI